MLNLSECNIIIEAAQCPILRVYLLLHCNLKFNGAFNFSEVEGICLKSNTYFVGVLTVRAHIFLWFCLFINDHGDLRRCEGFDLSLRTSILVCPGVSHAHHWAVVWVCGHRPSEFRLSGVRRGRTLPTLSCLILQNRKVYIVGLDVMEGSLRGNLRFWGGLECFGLFCLSLNYRKSERMRWIGEVQIWISVRLRFRNMDLALRIITNVAEIILCAHFRSPFCRRKHDRFSWRAKGFGRFVFPDRELDLRLYFSFFMIW